MRISWSVLVVGLILPVASVAADELTFTDVNRHVVRDIAMPAYADLAQNAAGLVEAIGAVCSKSSPEAVDAAVASYADTLEAWERAQVVRVGPAFEGDVASRIQFWPDRHGTGQRQVARALTAKDEALLDPETLATQSVALQGLPLIERLLYDHLVHGETGYACALAHAASRDLAELTAEVAHAWQAFADEVDAAGSGEGAFFSPFEPASAILKGVADELNLIVQQKLERPLGSDPSSGRAQLAESWRMQGSLANIATNLKTAQQIMTGPGGFADLLLATGGDAALAERLSQGFTRAQAIIGNLGMPLEAAVADPSAWDALHSLVDQVKDLRAMVAGELGPALGIGVGFNALDGD